MTTINIDKRSVPATARNKRIYPTVSSGTSSTTSSGSAVDSNQFLAKDASLLNYVFDLPMVDGSGAALFSYDSSSDYIIFNKTIASNQEVIAWYDGNIVNDSSTLLSNYSFVFPLVADITNNVTLKYDPSSMYVDGTKGLQSLGTGGTGGPDLTPRLNTTDSSLLTLTTRYNKTEASIGLLTTKVDASILVLTNRLNTSDSSLNTLTGRYNKTEASLGNLSAVKFDASILGLTNRLNTTDTSLNTLTLRHNFTEASLGTLTSRHIFTEASLGTLTLRHNVTESSLGTLTASFTGYTTRLNTTDSSLNTLRLRYNVTEASLGALATVARTGNFQDLAGKPTGTLNRIPKFVPASVTFGNSNISDDGTTVSITGNLDVQGSITATGEIAAYITSAVATNVFDALSVSSPLRKNGTNIDLSVNTTQFDFANGHLNYIGGDAGVSQAYVDAADDLKLSLSGGTMSNATKVVNLNADLLDGKNSTDFLWTTTAQLSSLTDIGWTYSRSDKDLMQFDGATQKWTQRSLSTAGVAASNHVHGNITNTGYLGSTANLPLITTTAGLVTTGSFGTGSTNFAAGDHTHSTYATSSHVHGNITNAGAIGSTTDLPIITTASGVLTTGTFGSAAGSFCQGNDSRLSDTRTPTNTTVSYSKLSTYNTASAGNMLTYDSTYGLTWTAPSTAALTFATTGGAAAGTTFNCSVARTISYVSIGAAALAGSSSQAFSSAALTASGNVTSTTSFGYATGAGGAVTQLTSRVTAVTLNKSCGTITMFSSAIAAAASSTFTFTNSMIAATDMLIVRHNSTTNACCWMIDAICGAGSATIVVKNISAASITSATPLKFTLIKGVTA